MDVESPGGKHLIELGRKKHPIPTVIFDRLRSVNFPDTLANQVLASSIEAVAYCCPRQKIRFINPYSFLRLAVSAGEKSACVVDVDNHQSSSSDEIAH